MVRVTQYVTLTSVLPEEGGANRFQYTETQYLVSVFGRRPAKGAAAGIPR
jgi:hypothetical protein